MPSIQVTWLKLMRNCRDPPRPDTPIDETSLRRYGASCRPRQQVVVTARRAPGGPPEPCGRLVALRRAKFEPQPDRGSANPGPRPSGVRTRYQPGGGEGRSVSSDSGKSRKEYDQICSAPSSARKRSVPEHTSIEAKHPISKEPPLESVTVTASSGAVRESPENPKQVSHVEKHPLPPSFDATAVSKAIGVVDDSFREVLDELTKYDTGSDDTGDCQETDTVYDGELSERRNIQETVRNSGAPGHVMSSQSSGARQSVGQGLAHLVGFDDKDTAAPRQEDSSRSQSVSSSVKSPCETADVSTSPLPDPARRLDLGADGVDTEQPGSGAGDLRRTGRGGRLVARSEVTAATLTRVPPSPGSGSTESSEEAEEDEGDDQELHHWVTQVSVRWSFDYMQRACETNGFNESI